MKITWFGHSCFRIDTGASSILIDPFLTGNATFEDAGIPVHQATKGVTHVALTHGHEDHTGDTRAHLQGDRRPAHRRARARHPYGGAGRGEDRSRQYRRHAPSRRLRPHLRSGLAFGFEHRDGRPVYLGACCGLVIAPSGGKTVYHMGDTAIFSDMGLINEIYAPEIGFVPIGDRYTMGAKTAALACKRFFQFELIVPCHYGTFPVLDQTADKFVAEMGGNTCWCPRWGPVRGLSQAMLRASQVAA